MPAKPMPARPTVDFMVGPLVHGEDVGISTRKADGKTFVLEVTSAGIPEVGIEAVVDVFFRFVYSTLWDGQSSQKDEILTA